jgi:hypothetical protein
MATWGIWLFVIGRRTLTSDLGENGVKTFVCVCVCVSRLNPILHSCSFSASARTLSRLHFVSRTCIIWFTKERSNNNTQQGAIHERKLLKDGMGVKIYLTSVDTSYEQRHTLHFVPVVCQSIIVVLSGQ